MALVTLADAKEQLRIESDNTDHDAHLTRIVDQASHIVTDFLKIDEDEYGTSPDDGSPAVPNLVQAATLLVIEKLFDGTPDEDPLTPAVRSILHRYRDPALV